MDPAHQIDGDPDLGGREAGHGFVEEQHLGSQASARAISRRLRPGVPKRLAGASA
jgi:hypothetical protein